MVDYWKLVIKGRKEKRMISYERYEGIMARQGNLIGQFLRGELEKETFLRELEECLRPIDSAEVVVGSLKELCAICEIRRGSKYADKVRRHEGANYERLAKYSDHGLEIWFSYLETTDGGFIPFTAFDIAVAGHSWSETELQNFWREVLDISTPSTGENTILQAVSVA